MGSYNHHYIGEEVEYKPPLRPPLGHCVPTTLKIWQEIHKTARISECIV